MASVLGRSKESVIAREHESVSHEALERFEQLVDRRLANEPVAYIRGIKEFWSLELKVDGRVLIPRPDTEILVQACLEEMERRSRCALAADVGTGSGAVAVALATQRPELRILATDVSGEALHLACENARTHGVRDRVCLLQADLLGCVRDHVLDVIAANLPYICTAEIAGLDAGVRDHEPHVALDGGEDGLRLVRRLAQDAPRVLAPRGLLALEVASSQADEVRSALAGNALLGDVAILEDLGRMKRVVTARRTG